MILSIGIAVLLFFLLRAIILRILARSISHLPGPPPGPWLVGKTRREEFNRLEAALTICQ